MDLGGLLGLDICGVARVVVGGLGSVNDVVLDGALDEELAAGTSKSGSSLRSDEDLLGGNELLLDDSRAVGGSGATGGGNSGSELELRLLESELGSVSLDLGSHELVAEDGAV